MATAMAVTARNVCAALGWRRLGAIHKRAFASGAVTDAVHGAAAEEEDLNLPKRQNDLYQVQARNNWRIEEVKEIYQRPLLDLVYKAATIHRQCHNPNEVQKCTLLSIKTGKACIPPFTSLSD